MFEYYFSRSFFELRMRFIGWYSFLRRFVKKILKFKPPFSLIINVAKIEIWEDPIRER